jgi:hypothetical protein
LSAVRAGADERVPNVMLHHAGPGRNGAVRLDPPAFVRFLGKMRLQLRYFLLVVRPPDVPDWNGEGDCITCARDKVLGPNIEADDERL